jgi:hypothetical protein
MLEQEIVAACSFACVERSSAFCWMQKSLDWQGGAAFRRPLPCQDGSAIYVENFPGNECGVFSA